MGVETLNHRAREETEQVDFVIMTCESKRLGCRKLSAAAEALLSNEVGFDYLEFMVEYFNKAIL